MSHFHTLVDTNEVTPSFPTYMLAPPPPSVHVTPYCSIYYLKC